MIYVILLMFDQKKLQRVQTTINKIYNRNVHLTLY